MSQSTSGLNPSSQELKQRLEELERQMFFVQRENFRLTEENGGLRAEQAKLRESADNAADNAAYEVEPARKKVAENAKGEIAALHIELEAKEAQLAHANATVNTVIDGVKYEANVDVSLRERLEQLGTQVRLHDSENWEALKPFLDPKLVQEVNEVSADNEEVLEENNKFRKDINGLRDHIFELNAHIAYHEEHENLLRQIIQAQTDDYTKLADDQANRDARMHHLYENTDEVLGEYVKGVERALIQNATVASDLQSITSQLQKLIEGTKDTIETGWSKTNMAISRTNEANVESRLAFIAELEKCKKSGLKASDIPRSSKPPKYGQKFKATTTSTASKDDTLEIEKAEHHEEPSSLNKDDSKAKEDLDDRPEIPETQPTEARASESDELIEHDVKLQTKYEELQRFHEAVAAENAALNKKIHRTLEAFIPKAKQMRTQKRVNQKTQDLLRTLEKIVKEGLENE